MNLSAAPLGGWKSLALVLAAAALPVVSVAAQRWTASDDSAAVSTELEQRWEAALPQVRDVLLGSGFDAERLAAQFCGFDADGHYRPDFASFYDISAPLDDRTRAELERLADSFNAPLLAEARVVVDALTWALAVTLERDDYVHYPIDDPRAAERARARVAKRRGSICFQKSFVTDGFRAIVQIRPREFPALEAAEQQLDRVRQARDHALSEFLERTH